MTVFFTPYVLHHLGLVRYGLFIFTGSLISVLSTFDGGIRGTSQRFFGVYAGQGDVERTTRLLLSLALVIGAFGVVISATGWVLAYPLVSLVHVPSPLRAESAFLFRTLGILITTTFLHNLLVGILQAHGRFRLITATVLAVYVVWVGGLIATVQLGWGLYGVAGVFVGQQVLLLVVVVPSATHYLSRRGIGLLPWPELRAILGFGGRVQISTLSVLVNDKLDALVVGVATSAATVALYNAGSSFAENVGGVTVNALAPAQTALTNTLGRDGDLAARTSFVRLQRLWTLGVTGWFVVAGSASWWAVIAWLGPGFRLGGEVAVIAVAANMAYSLSAMLRAWCTVVGQPGIESRAGIVSVVVNLALTVPLAYLYGALGVASATLAGQMVGGVVLLHQTRRHLPHSVPNPFRQVPFGSAVAAAAVVIGLEVLIRPVVPQGGFGLLACGVPALVGLIVYLTVSLGPYAAAMLCRAALVRVRSGVWISPPLTPPRMAVGKTAA